jgi:hypothetical protein
LREIEERVARAFEERFGQTSRAKFAKNRALARKKITGPLHCAPRA